MKLDARFVMASFLALLLLPWQHGAQAADAVKLRMNIIAPPQNWLTQELAAWGRDVTAATGGRVVIESVAAPLGPIPRVFDIVETNVADISPGQHGPIGGRFPVTQILDIPFIAPTAEAASVALWRVHKSHLEKAQEHRGIVLLGLWASAPTHVMSKASSLATLDGVRGKKLIAVSPTAGKVAAALGASPVGGPPTEWHEMLSRGIADGALSSVTAAEAFRLTGVLQSMIAFDTSLFRTTFFLGMNQAKWDSLSAADRAAVMALSGETLARRMGIAFDLAEANATRSLQGKLAIVRADPAVLEQLATRLAFIETDWTQGAAKAGVDGAAALAQLRSEVKNYRPAK